MTLILTKQQPPYFWQFDQNCFEEMADKYFSAEYWQTNKSVLGKESGRGTTWFVQHDDHALVLRHYLRGGLISKLSTDQYIFQGIDKTRSFSEFNILQALSAQGFPVPKPAAAQVIKKGLMYRADLLTHKIPDARDLVQVLQEARDSSFYSLLGQVIASFHQAGVFHADLNIQNILYDASGKFWIIDFDRARIRKVQNAWQENNMKRLKRSFEKELIRHDIKWTQANWESLYTAYQAAKAR
jgi:3-deoxy-D-manno-octulosonic acid kinase